jgi:hypothetical protein
MPNHMSRGSRAAIVTKPRSAAREHALIANLISTDGMIIARRAVSFKGNQRVPSAGGPKR